MDEYGSVDDIVIIAGMNNDDIVDATSASSSSSFVLHRIANAIQKQTQLHHKYVAVDESYPALRRQKRLSYAAAHVLENALLNPDATSEEKENMVRLYYCMRRGVMARWQLVFYAPSAVLVVCRLYRCYR
jgi:hypothetical protein